MPFKKQTFAKCLPFMARSSYDILGAAFASINTKGQRVLRCCFYKKSAFYQKQYYICFEVGYGKKEECRNK